MQERAKILGQKLYDRRGVCVNAHVSLDPLAIFTQVCIETLEIAEDVACVMQQGMPTRSQCDPLGESVKKLHA